jgi:hypothetical protein
MKFQKLKIGVLYFVWKDTLSVPGLKKQDFLIGKIDIERFEAQHLRRLACDGTGR